jgi:multimeric flavodoxin WrbA
MRILGISGSPRGRESRTRRLVERVLEGSQSAGAQVELADLSEMNIGCCLACGSCHVKGTCSRKDEFAPLYEKMLASDGLVLGSPVYFTNITAQLKTVIDRMSHAIHCQLLLGTYACSVATAGSAYDPAVAYMSDVLVRFGCTVVGGTGGTMSVPESLRSAEQDAIALGRDLVQAVQEQRTYPEQDSVHAAMHERFKRLVGANKDNWPFEYDYWKSRNWL